MAIYKGYIQDKNGDTLLPNVSWENIIDKPNPYPIGAIYLSVDSTSPSELFGGEWEQIKDVFLLAGGNTYEVGSTGGEANHTLTVDEMPSHTHGVGYANNLNNIQLNGGGGAYRVPWSTDGANGNSELIAKSTGGNKPHNNMPPYLAVYVWKRIA